MSKSVKTAHDVRKTRKSLYVFWILLVVCIIAVRGLGWIMRWEQLREIKASRVLVTSSSSDSETQIIIALLDDLSNEVKKTGVKNAAVWLKCEQIIAMACKDEQLTSEEKKQILDHLRLMRDR